MKKVFYPILILLAATLSLRAVAPPRGDDRLRELVAFPEMNLTLNYGITFECDEWTVSKNTAPEIQISRLQEELKQHPDNARSLLQLGVLLDGQGDTNAAKGCYRQAEQVCRNRLAARPQDGLLLTDLGTALWDLGDADGAENAFRKSVLVSSNDWRCWARLGNFLPTASFSAMFPEKLRGQIGESPRPPTDKMLDFRPAPDALKRAEEACIEASGCFDHAMALAPSEAEVYFQRAGFICVSNWQSCLFRHYQSGEAIDPTRWVSAFFSPESVVNLQKAAELDYNNYERISLAAYFDWASAMIQLKWPANFTIDMLPETSRRSIRDAMTHLENLSEKADSRLAAGALECHGFLNFTFKNNAAALADFKRAVALDPSREASWDLWLAMLVTSKASPGEMVVVCKSRLDHEASARNHLLLAKTLLLVGKWSEAMAQAETAGRLETNNVVPPLFIAAIALKQSAQTNFLSVAWTNLASANDLLMKMPDGDERQKRSREWGMNTIIFYVLNNEPDSARSTARDYLKIFPDNESVKEILRNMGEK